MRHKEWKMGTMVESIQPIGPSNLLNNMVQVFANTGNTLPPGNLRTPFVARHESTAPYRWGVFHPEEKSKQRLMVEELGVHVLHPKIPPKGNKIRSGYLTPAFSGAQKRVEMLCHPHMDCESLTPTQGATQQSVD